MMSKKTFILIVIVILLVATGYFFWMVQNPTQTSTTPQSIPTGEQFSVRSESNADVSVKNFYQDTKTEVFDEANDALLDRTVNYDILYFTIDQSFLISLRGVDLQLSRDAAEGELLHRLDVPKEEACKLRVAVTVPFDVSEVASGIDYGLSFCANGLPLPEAK